MGVTIDSQYDFDTLISFKDAIVVMSRDLEMVYSRNQIMSMKLLT